jgi:hypothetical protein
MDGMLYASTAGAFRTLLTQLNLLAAATDRGTGGERLAARLARFAAECWVAFERLLPTSKDWNDDLRAGAE